MDRFKHLGQYIAVVFIIALAKDTLAYNSHYLQELCEDNTNDSIHRIDLIREQHTYGTVRVVRSGGYKFGLDCRLVIWAPEHHHITVRFRRVDTHKPDDGDRDCDDLSSANDRLLLAGNTTTHYFCGTWTPSYALISTNNMLSLHFISKNHEGSNDHIGFDLYYTAYHDSYCDTEHGREFRCYRGGRCIPGELTCDGMDNCGDWSDERSTVCGLPVGSIVMITVICVLVAGTCIAGAIYYFVDSKSSGSRRRSRRSRTREVEPEGPYTVPYNGPVLREPQAPPPYSQAPPMYSAEEKKEAPPPAYENPTYDGETTGEAAQQETDTNGSPA